MPRRTVCFVARQDFESKPGGDTVQWLMYDRAARVAGWDVVTWFDDAPMPEADVLHAFNVDRPLELYPKLLEAKRRGIPFILSTIHHPHDWLRRFRRAEPPTGLLGRLLYRGPAGRSIAMSESIKEAAMLVAQRRIGRVRDLAPGWRARTTWLLDNAARIALLSYAEGAHVSRDFGYAFRPGQRLIVPNWAEGIGSASAAPPPPFSGLLEAPVLVVGRVEPRKNSVRICRLAGIARRHVVFVGRPHPSEGAFVTAFEHTARAHGYVRWIPGVARSEMASYYYHASFLLTAGLVEVSPLVDVEALALGCPIVTTRYAAHHELLPDTPVCDPYDDDDILRWLAWRPVRGEPRGSVDADRCRHDLIGAYAALVG